jgi:hypothetical protein
VCGGGGGGQRFGYQHLWGLCGAGRPPLTWHQPWCGVAFLFAVLIPLLLFRNLLGFASTSYDDIVRSIPNVCDGALASRPMDVPDSFLNHTGQPHHRASRMVADMQGVLGVVRGSDRVTTSIELEALDATLGGGARGTSVLGGAGGPSGAGGGRSGSGVGLPLVHALVAAAVRGKLVALAVLWQARCFGMVGGC